ncbi:MAG TPA: DUF2189 domain-containing protein [Gammaproteobacteria bacterium]|nr:DUF2189 domain-containing protein [Gammaproteobacteria bacterium]
MHSDDAARSEAWLPTPRALPSGAALGWLALGWRDFRAAPWESLTFGLLVVVISYALTAIALVAGGLLALYVLLGGFMLIAPLLAFALYDTSRQLARGEKPSVGHGLRAAWSNVANHALFALVLLVILLVWARAAAMVYVFFPADTRAGVTAMLPFLLVGTAVGAVFAGLVFMASTVSLPMMLDRRADVVSAVITSFRAVIANPATMALWGGLIAALTAAGFATGFLGLAVAVPVLGYATWHCYAEAIPGAEAIDSAVESTPSVTE